jgi:hypothetical protein
MWRIYITNSKIAAANLVNPEIYGDTLCATR